MGRVSLRSMGLGQRIATLALVVLALIAAVSVLSGCGSSDRARHAGSGTAASASAGGSRGGQDDSASAADTVRLSSLPREAQRTVELIDAGGPFPYSRDGVVFGNYEHALPQQPRGYYHEYTVKTPGASNRGTRRIITGKDGTLYYTGDHYRTFQKVLR